MDFTASHHAFSPFGDVALMHRFGVQLEKNGRAFRYTFRYGNKDADAVFLASSFTSWDNGRRMTRLANGTWELTLDANHSLEGECYKFRVLKNGIVSYRTDPFAKREEGSGGRASVIACETPLADRALPFFKAEPRAIHLLEVSLASFYTKDGRLPFESGAACSYRKLAELLTVYMKSTGYTHVKLLPRERSEATSYFAPSPRYGTPEDFAEFVNCLHRNGVGVIASFFYPISPDDCRILTSAIDYLLSHYALDGIFLEEAPDAPRDAVGAMLQNLALLRRQHPNALFYADKLLDASCPVRSKAREAALTDLLASPFDLRKERLSATIAALLENGTLASQSKHLTRGGEHSLMETFFGSYEQKFAQNRLYQLLLMAARGDKLSFMMQSLAPFRPWQDHLQPEWYMADFKLHRAHRRFVRALNAFYLETPLLSEANTRMTLVHLDLDASIFSLKLEGEGGEMLFVFNCSDKLSREYSLTVDHERYVECFSSDEERYAGEGYVHRIALTAENGKLTLDLAPLCAVILQPTAIKQPTVAKKSVAISQPTVAKTITI